MANFFKKAGIICGFVIVIAGIYYAYSKVATTNAGSGPVHIEFIKTSDDADATLICQEGMAILVDTGEESDCSAILEMLDKYNIDKINYLIISHGDKDHIGSMEEIANTVSIGKVIAPYYTDSEKLRDILDKMDNAGIPILYPAHNMRISAGAIDINCYPALEKHYSQENNYSLAVLISHGDVDMLFTGDSLRKRGLELERIHWTSIELYKVPHHGRANSESENLFKAVNPSLAVVTSDKCDREISQAASDCQCDLYFTRPDGLSFLSDGATIQLISSGE